MHISIWKLLMSNYVERRHVGKKKPCGKREGPRKVRSLMPYRSQPVCSDPFTAHNPIAGFGMK